MGVVQLPSSREQHYVARGLNCGHTTTAPVSKTLTKVGCPNCSGQEMLRMFEHVRLSKPHFKCECGEVLFFITENGAYCPNCGRDVCAIS